MPELTPPAIDAAAAAATSTTTSNESDGTNNNETNVLLYDVRSSSSSSNRSSYQFTSTKRSNGYPCEFQLGYGNDQVLFVSQSAAVGMPIIRRMVDSVKSIVKETGEKMLRIADGEHLYKNPSCPFLPIMPRNYDMDAICSLSVYGEFKRVSILDNSIESNIPQFDWELNKVGSATNLLKRSIDYSESSIIQCLIHVDGVTDDAYNGIVTELQTMLNWIIDPTNKVEEPIRRLFITLRDSGAIEYGYGRSFIVQLLETSVAYRQRDYQMEHKRNCNADGRSRLVVLNEFCAYPQEMREQMLDENRQVLDAFLCSTPF